ncbi:hypothetical protein Tco_0629412 [Tanacetum coccineum]|uniref:FRIGIDA-like protein n=1 Tax=Tanacetum coccineum TaxID=301880 RepID=A0ABQ4WT19_9ASTR
MVQIQKIPEKNLDVLKVHDKNLDLLKVIEKNLEALKVHEKSLHGLNKGASENVSKEVKKTSDAPIIKYWFLIVRMMRLVVLESLDVQYIASCKAFQETTTSVSAARSFKTAAPKPYEQTSQYGLGFLREVNALVSSIVSSACYTDIAMLGIAIIQKIPEKNLDVLKVHVVLGLFKGHREELEALKVYEKSLTEVEDLRIILFK